MGWFGKIVGGAIGFSIAGPLGAAAGMAFGHYALDQEEEQSYAEQPQLTREENMQHLFFVSTFSLLAKLAKADGVVSQEEIEEINRFIDHELRLGSQEKKYAIDIFRSAKESQYSFDTYAREFFNAFYHDREILVNMLDLLFRVSFADGELHHNEERMLRSAAHVFNIHASEFDSIKARYSKDTDKYYKILGLNSSASNEEIRKKYRELAVEYHPDKIIAKGLPPEFVDFAKNKFQEIQEAYSNIKTERKFS